MTKKTFLKPPPIAIGAGMTETVHAGIYRAVSDLVLFGDTSPVTIFTVPANTIVYDIFAEIVEAFNGTTPTISVGVGGAVSRHMAEADITEGTIGFYGNAAIKPWKYTADTDIIATLTLSGASTGKVRFYALFMPYAAENPLVK